MIKLSAKHPRHVTSFGSKIARENSYENAQNTNHERKLTRIISINLERVKIILNSQNISRTHYEFSRNFARDFSMHRGSDSRNKGVNSKKKIKKLKENQKLTGKRPRPTDLMDPDQANAPGALD